jgi:hypothetical protein
MDNAGNPSPPAEANETPRDLYEGERQVREKWGTIVATVWLLRFLGNCERQTIRDTCLRLHGMERAKPFAETRSNLEEYAAQAPKLWPYAEGLADLISFDLFEDASILVPICRS